MPYVYRHLIDFLNGRRGDVFTIAVLPPDLAAALCATSNAVLIKRDYALKLRGKHRLLPHHFYQVHLALNYGWCGLNRGDLLVVHSDTAIFNVDFKLAIKSLPAKQEVWLKTFHKVQPGDVRRLISKSTMLRDFKN